MKQIKLSDTHYIVVDETQEIKVNDWCIMLDSFGNLFSGCQQYLGESAGHYLNKGHIKIIHSTQPIKGVGYYPISLAKEIAGEVDVNEKAYKYAVDYRCPATNDQEYCKHDIISAYNYGYNQSLEDNKDKKYTEEDLRNVIRIYSHAENELSIGEIIQSLQPKTEWEVEIVEDKLKRK